MINWLKILYNKEKIIFKQKKEINRLNEIINKNSNEMMDIKKQLGFALEENFRKDEQKGK